MWASINAHTEISRMLLERPEIDVNLQTEDGLTALMWASRWGYTEIADLIKSHPNSKKQKIIWSCRRNLLSLYCNSVH